jgi:hypothetical protein
LWASAGSALFGSVRGSYLWPGLNEILGDYLQYFGVIYGLLLGLLAVATYQNHSDVEKAVADEASSLAALYRDTSAYPEPDRTEECYSGIHPLYDWGCLAATASGDWSVESQSRCALASAVGPIRAKDKIGGGTSRRSVASVQWLLPGPAEHCIFSVTTGIPPVMWYTVAIGALINILLIWLFNLRLGTHLLLRGLISFFTGTMICLIALLDHPFRGEVGVSPQAFELIYSQMMQE